MSIKVLVFESDAAFASELRNELGKLGCSTCVVDDGSVGLQQASAEKPDLILLSIELPRMNGFSVCNKLKKDAGLKDVPLIIMSSESSDETFEQHRKLRTRAEDYVHKPIAFGELLGHIRTFVQLGEAPVENLSDTDGIVIDDEIAIQNADIEEDEGTQIAARPDFSPQPKMRNVDQEVDAFTESAFGRLQEGSAHPPPVTEQAKDFNGTRGEGAAPSTRPGSARSARPAANDAELARYRAEAEKATARAAEFERDLAGALERIKNLQEDAESEQDRLQREVDELKTRLTQASKGGGISSREFLDLREALNKKDKEILALKEAASKKDKELFEMRDKALASERMQSEFDDKMLEKERELADIREKAEELTSKLGQATNRAEDLKSKLSKAQNDLETRAKEATELLQKTAKEVADLQQKNAQEIAELKRKSAETLEQNDASMAALEAEHQQTLQQAKAKHQAVLADARAQADKQRAEAVSAREAELRSETDAKLAALHRAHQDDIAKLKAEQALQLDAASKDASERLAVQQTELQQQLSEAVASVEAKAAATLAEGRAQAEAQLKVAEQKVAGLERDLGEMGKRRQEVEDAKRASDAANEARIADLNERFSQLTSARDELEKGFAGARDRIATLEVDLSGVRGDLQDTRSKLDAEAARLQKAVAKWEADRATLERAKDALAVALAQVDEVEGRPIE
jgi:CheY-like chemotaxis protein